MFIQDRCPSLKTFESALSTSGSQRLSRNCFTDFLGAMQSLSKLSIRDGFQVVMSSEALAHIAGYKFLVELELPPISEKLVIDLCHTSTSATKFFPNIRNFKACLSDTGLGLLLPHLANVRILIVGRLDHVEESLHILAEAQLTALWSLKLESSQVGIVRGTDIALLARHSSKLAHLDLGLVGKVYKFVNGLAYPSSQGVCDEVIDELARRLPDLETLLLNMDYATLTEASLISLGTYCEKLAKLSLSVDASFEELVRTPQPGLFPCLKVLKLSQPVSHRRQYSNVSRTASHVCQMMPNLEPTDLDLGISNLVDWTIAMAMRDQYRDTRTRNR